MPTTSKTTATQKVMQTFSQAIAQKAAPALSQTASQISQIMSGLQTKTQQKSTAPSSWLPSSTPSWLQTIQQTTSKPAPSAPTSSQFGKCEPQTSSAACAMLFGPPVSSASPSSPSPPQPTQQVKIASPSAPSQSAQQTQQVKTVSPPAPSLPQSLPQSSEYRNPLSSVVPLWARDFSQFVSVARAKKQEHQQYVAARELVGQQISERGEEVVAEELRRESERLKSKREFFERRKQAFEEKLKPYQELLAGFKRDLSKYEEAVREFNERFGGQALRLEEHAVASSKYFELLQQREKLERRHVELVGLEQKLMQEQRELESQGIFLNRQISDVASRSLAFREVLVTRGIEQLDLKIPHYSALKDIRESLKQQLPFEKREELVNVAGGMLERHREIDIRMAELEKQYFEAVAPASALVQEKGTPLTQLFDYRGGELPQLHALDVIGHAKSFGIGVTHGVAGAVDVSAALLASPLLFVVGRGHEAVERLSFHAKSSIEGFVSLPRQLISYPSATLGGIAGSAVFFKGVTKFGGKIYNIVFPQKQKLFATTVVDITGRFQKGKATITTAEVSTQFIKKAGEKPVGHYAGISYAAEFDKPAQLEVSTKTGTTTFPFKSIIFERGALVSETIFKGKSAVIAKPLEQLSFVTPSGQYIPLLRASNFVQAHRPRSVSFALSFAKISDVVRSHGFLASKAVEIKNFVARKLGFESAKHFAEAQAQRSVMPSRIVVGRHVITPELVSLKSSLFRGLSYLREVGRKEFQLIKSWTLQREKPPRAIGGGISKETGGAVSFEKLTSISKKTPLKFSKEVKQRIVPRAQAGARGGAPPGGGDLFVGARRVVGKRARVEDFHVPFSPGVLREAGLISDAVDPRFEGAGAGVIVGAGAVSRFASSDASKFASNEITRFASSEVIKPIEKLKPGELTKLKPGEFQKLKPGELTKLKPSETLKPSELMKTKTLEITKTKEIVKPSETLKPGEPQIVRPATISKVVEIQKTKQAEILKPHKIEVLKSPFPPPPPPPFPPVLPPLEKKEEGKGKLDFPRKRVLSRALFFRRSAREFLPLADLAAKTITELKLSRAARHPRARVARKFWRESAGLFVPTAEMLKFNFPRVKKLINL